MIKRKENAYVGHQAQGETDDLIGFSKASAIRVKLNRGDV
jgi:hypothetical protein